MIAALFMIASCGKKKEEEPVKTRDLVFESFTYDLVGKGVYPDSLWADSTVYIRFMGQGVIPKDIGDTDIKHLRDTLLKLSGLTIEGGITEPLLPQGMELTDLPTGETDLNGEIHTSLSTTLMTPRAVVWKNQIYTYAEMSPHGNCATKYINFCMTDGKILHLYELMKPGYQLRLRDIIRKKIQEKNLELLVNINEIEIPKEFAITSQGLIFSFDPYDIAPYAEGTIEVEVDLDSLQDMLSRRGEYILTGIMPPADE